MGIFFRRFCNFGLACLVETRGADHHADAARDTRIKIGERRFGAGEIDQHCAARDAAGMGGNGDISVTAKCRCRQPNGGTLRRIECRDQCGVRI